MTSWHGDIPRLSAFLCLYCLHRIATGYTLTALRDIIVHDYY